AGKSRVGRGTSPGRDGELIDDRAAATRQGQRLAGSLALNAPEQSVGALQRIAIDREQQVADLEARIECRRALRHIRDDQHRLTGVEPVSRLQAEPERNDPESEVTVSNVSVGDHIAHRSFDRLDWDTKDL